MPTYDYECGECGFAFEKFQSIKAPSVRRCPECSKLKVKRLIGTGGGIIFKGSGFYQTDYRSEGYKSAEKKDKEASSGSTSDSKSDSKSESKTDSSKTSTAKSEAKTDGAKSE